MAKENPPAKDLQVAFDLGNEASDPPPDRTGAAKKARAKPAKPDGKLVKNRDGGGGAAGERGGERQSANPPLAKPVTAAQSAPSESDGEKSAPPHLPATKAEPATAPPAKDAPTLSAAGEDGAPASSPKKDAAPRPEQPMAAKEPEPAPGNGAEPAGRPPVEIPASEEMDSEEMDSEEMDSEETERIIQLINNREGCWKVLPGGERVALSDQEWRSELARHFRRGTPAGS